MRLTDEHDRTHGYLVADRAIRLNFDNKRRRLACRQITRLDEKGGHQTQVIPTRGDPDPALIAYAMFSRWRQENFFRYQRAHCGLDALDAYETEPDDPTRLVANPLRRDAERATKEARRSLAAAQAEVDWLAAAAKAIPAKVPLVEVRPAAVRLDVERKRIMDAIAWQPTTPSQPSPG